jgi:hypothetical protein
MYLLLQIYHEVHFFLIGQAKKYGVSSHKIISKGANGLKQMLD